VVYNFDIIAITFAVFSLLLLIRGRVRTAGFLLGLSVASKVIPGVILLPCFLYLARKNIRSSTGFLLGFVLTVATVFAPVYTLALKGLDVMMLEWHVSQTAVMYCENCFYVMIVSELENPTMRLASQILMVAVPLGVMLATSHPDKNVTLTRRSLLMVPALVSVSYVYSPQMNVMIAPAYLLAASPLAFGALALSDLLNVLIMVFFFRPEMLCSILRIWSCPAVWGRESPIQWIAFSRIVLLWVFIVACTISSKGKLRISGFLRATDAWRAKKGLDTPPRDD
jgi:hypothetical protein